MPLVNSEFSKFLPCADLEYSHTTLLMRLLNGFCSALHRECKPCAGACLSARSIDMPRVESETDNSLTSPSKNSI